MGPDGSVEAGATAATGVMAASRSVDLGIGNDGAAAPTTPAKTRQAIIATPNAGLRAVRVINCCTAATAADEGGRDSRGPGSAKRSSAARWSKR